MHIAQICPVCSHFSYSSTYPEILIPYIYRYTHTIEPPDLQHRDTSGPSPCCSRLLLSGAGWPCPDAEPCSEPGSLPIPQPFPSVPHHASCTTPSAGSRGSWPCWGGVWVGQSVFSVCWQLGCSCMTSPVILICTAAEQKGGSFFPPQYVYISATVCIHIIVVFQQW